MNRIALARLHGGLLLFSGVWPIVHLRSFEAVFGPKVDRWLVRTVAGLLLTGSAAQLSAARSPASVDVARVVGLGMAGTLAAIDLRYAPPGRISKVYLVDAAGQLGLIALWLSARPAGEAASRAAHRRGTPRKSG